GGGGGGAAPAVVAAPPPVPAAAPALAIQTDLFEVRIKPGESQLRQITVNNPTTKTYKVAMEVAGDIFRFITFEKGNFELKPGEETQVKTSIQVPANQHVGTYLGDILIKYTASPEITRRIPVTLVITREERGLLDVDVDIITSPIRLTPQGIVIKYVTGLINLGEKRVFDVIVNYTIKDEEGRVIKTKQVSRALETTLSFVDSLTIDPILALDGGNQMGLKAGGYTLEVNASYNGYNAYSQDSFLVQAGTPVGELVFQDWMLWAALAAGIGAPAALGGQRLRKYLRARREKKSRYLMAKDYTDLPEGPMWVGRIAETDLRMEFDPNDLKTHCITAGATGSGKSVSASVFVEEILKLKIPVVCFDPTAQWTGFVRPNKDPAFFKVYQKFGMKPEDARPFKGLIYEVTDPNVRIDFRKYMNPGEITVFTLNKLRPGEYDQAVMNIIDTVFQMQWEEALDLKMLVVFDEIHRLLEKYGGKGGYIALEKGAREFRKWGIGMMMVSQVSGDFREELRSNALTEVQLHTKSTTDTDRIKAKYGDDYAIRCTKLEIGVGMVANPKYNRGKPVFVNFRPVLHEAHKIPDKELEMYKEFDKKLSAIEATIQDWKKRGIDTFDIELELKLAKDKLKEGRFRMAEIYTESLTESMKKYEKGLGGGKGGKK
ncbi:MAG: DUF87 domain-containing protein, partial [Euryarchaeota archaeon]|nr:DUF87 domain-containing protein [Euryarchaeota archaeon]